MPAPSLTADERQALATAAPGFLAHSDNLATANYAEQGQCLAEILDGRRACPPRLLAWARACVSAASSWRHTGCREAGTCTSRQPA